mmetsp:Transcript_26912/g.86349  ORF Transcript_26912/g.86349 Transcript_26912/m.86349 type:complete len:273 (+) Transcript_26912:68-886(+)
MIAVPALVKLLPKVLLAGALLRRSASVAPAAASAALMRPARAGPSDEGSAVQALREALTASGLGDASLWGVPLTGESGAPLLRQFLRARRWCVDDARRMLQGTLRWRRENRVDELSSMSNFGEGMPLDKIIGKAGAGPLVLASLPGRAALADVNRFVRWRIAMQEAAIRTLCLTQSSPAFTLVMDVSGLRRFHLSKEARLCTAELSRVMQAYYPDFLAKTLVVNTPPAFACAWSLLRPLLPPALLVKLQLQKGPPPDAIADACGPSGSPVPS